MKKPLVLFLITLLVSLITGRAQAQNQPAQLLRYIVMITFKEKAPIQEIQEVDDSFKNLATKLQVVKSYETGTALADGSTKAITHVYSFSFASEKDLASYGASPEHQQHIKIGKSIIERGQAVDYWVEK